MNDYNHDRDYCGPEGMHISKLIPRRLFGVDINRQCYLHDQDWSDGDGHTRDNKNFRRRIRRQYEEENKPLAGFFVSWVYYFAVCLGRLVLWLKGVR